MIPGGVWAVLKEFLGPFFFFNRLRLRLVTLQTARLLAVC